MSFWNINRKPNKPVGKTPSFNFKLPSPQGIMGVLSKSIEGKWKGSVVQDVITNETKHIHPYSYSCDYAAKFSQIGWNGVGVEGGIASVGDLQNWQFFDNKIVKSWDEMVSVETTIEIEKIGDNKFEFRDIDVYKKMNIRNYHWEYLNNHNFLSNFLDEGQDMQEKINDNIVGMEVPSEKPIIMSKTGEFYSPLNKIGDIDGDGIVDLAPPKALDPQGNMMMRMLVEDRECILQHVSDDQIVVHCAIYEEREIDMSGIITAHMARSVSQYRAEFIRVREKASTQINVKGDYVDDRDTIIQDSVINRSNIGSGQSRADQLRDAKSLYDEGLIDDAEYKLLKKEILGR